MFALYVNSYYVVNFSTANYRWWAYPVMLRSFIFTTPMWATFTMVRDIPWSPTVSVWHTHWFSTITFTNICRYVAWALSLRFSERIFRQSMLEKLVPKNSPRYFPGFPTLCGNSSRHGKISFRGVHRVPPARHATKHPGVYKKSYSF